MLVQLVEEIKTRPGHNEQEQQPEDLQSVLKKHQLHTLKFMVWRESRTPSGGILADEAGLGKTQAVIGFILRSKETDTPNNLSDSEPNKLHGKKLIICSGYFVKEWEEKLQRYVKPNRLSVNVFHGPKRTCQVEELATFDVVLTSQELVTSEFKKEGILFKIKRKLDYFRQSARHPQLHNSFVADLRALS
jgi:SNF2 family DNA or RNA helicase